MCVVSILLFKTMLKSNMKILSLGDCNTLGVGQCLGRAYPEILSATLGADLSNCGFTMSTVREGEYFFRDNYDESVRIVTIQYGLVDSWETFAYAPYVLYYPDNFFRKFARKFVKKYKKICRNFWGNRLFGVSPVVSVERYAECILNMMANCNPHTRVFLIETVPNLDVSRNPNIERYNQVLRQLSDDDARVELIEVYDYFSIRPDLYLDNTHINGMGHEYISRAIIKKNNLRYC